ncbi:MAG: GNAT family N-acetyltransferase [Deltaproteobacteria bacterium]|nr:GNAT family N-acetyltransferase [Deltaproteobacteria bacterium]
MLMRPVRDGIRRLTGRDHWEVLGFLRQSPEANAYLLGQIARQALDREAVAGVFAGFWRGGALAGIVCVGSNLVVSEPCSDDALDAFALFAARSAYVIRVVVGPDAAVAAFMDRYGREPDAIALERPHQILYKVDRVTHLPADPCPELRPADVTELEHLLQADLSMVMEELGFDPFSPDLPSFRRGWLRRIREQRSWVVGPLGAPVFKCDHSAVSDDVIQLAGVFTAPESRGRGIARRAISAMCELLFREVPCVTLYVHSENARAIRLYESLGFHEAGRVRSVWFA